MGLLTSSMSQETALAVTIQGWLLYGAIICVLSRNRISIGKLALVCVVMPIAQVEALLFLPKTVQSLPMVYDQNIALLDATLGFQPSVQMSALLGVLPGLHWMCAYVYMWLLATIAVAASGELRTGRSYGLGVVPSSIVLGVLGSIIYFYVPAVGPAPFFGLHYADLLRQPHFIGGHADFSKVPRNCVPSLHTSWALLAFWSTRGHIFFARFFCGVFLILTMMACLGLGWHYLTDLVVAVPFMLFIRAICAVGVPLVTRAFPALVGFCLLIAWCTLIRSGVSLPMAHCTVPFAMFITVITAWLLERRLALQEGAFVSGTEPHGASSNATPRQTWAFCKSRLSTRLRSDIVAHRENRNTTDGVPIARRLG